ncbi:class I SAM-dependent methyltransferase [Limisphaera ngatamarikiensis]|uniref:Class I SAM-dependent methyltransferase n=1 Tax=Limisphaera ngatamarikiensis TaxID=1324935 RepID=A0A6M1RHL4_9BACT|nr:class I SAM-dependent methyltransferase [Limisphaera ngatamarikiensis]NGO39126.1 class I SAM-dependent methyltransferase [Limisphaera ngatamarikiensis]
MKRVPEPELMTETEQARAYAQADFSEPHSRYVELFLQTFPDRPRRASVLDLGCGPGDVTRRFARACPHYRFLGVDGSPAMLRLARRLTAREPDLHQRIRYRLGRLPQARIPRGPYDIIVATSFLHHLPDPMVLWHAIRKYGRPGTLVLVADLRRPRSPAHARQLVQRYAAGEPRVLQRDFYRSLLAAFTPSEVRQQLRAAQLHTLTVRVISDRHLLVTGRLPD